MRIHCNVPVANLRLNQIEIEALLEFLQEESARVEHLRSPGHKH